MNKTSSVTITPQTFFFAILFIAFAYIFIELRHLFVLFLMTIIFSIGLRPLVDKMEQKGVQRIWGVVLLYVIFLTCLTFLMILTASTFFSQLGSFISNLPTLVGNILEFINERLPLEYRFAQEGLVDSLTTSIRDQIREANLDFANLQEFFSVISSNIRDVGETGISFVSFLVEAIFTFFIFMIVTAYLLVRPKKIYEGWFEYIPLKNRAQTVKIASKVEKSLGEWLIGQLVVMIFVGVLSYIVVMIPFWLGVENYGLYQFALLIGILAAVLEALPNIGPTATILLVLLLALGIGESVGIMIYIVISFTVIQQIEGLFLVPNVMKKAVDLDPVFTILGVTAGFILYGIFGAVLSIPLLAALKIVLLEIYKRRA